MIWDELIKAEPRLEKLYERVKRIQDDKSKPSFCANLVWYGWVKAEMCRLVGYEATTPVAGSSEAYDLAYKRLYNLLPDCRNCFGCTEGQ